MRFPEVFGILDSDHVGLISFQSFLQNLDKIVVPSLPQTSKEMLFSQMDNLRIGLVSLDQFRSVINSSEVDLRILAKDERAKANDSFEWVQNVIRDMLDWIIEARVSLSEAFKMMDSDFDGAINMKDL